MSEAVARPRPAPRKVRRLAAPQAGEEMPFPGERTILRLLMTHAFIVKSSVGRRHGYPEGATWTYEWRSRNKGRRVDQRQRYGTLPRRYQA